MAAATGRCRCGTGREQARFTGHTSWVRSVAVTPDGTRVVSGSEDGSVQVWDLASGTEIARWDGDYSIIGCTALPGQPLKIVVGQGQGRPYSLELRGQDTVA